MGYAAGEHRQALFATGVILFVIIMILNTVANVTASADEGDAADEDLRLAPDRRSPHRPLGLDHRHRSSSWSSSSSSSCSKGLPAVELGVPVHESRRTWARRAASSRPSSGRSLLTVGGHRSSPPRSASGTAIYLTEYTREGPVTRVIRFGADCLAGIPSIIFGLFGFIFFVTMLKLGLVHPQRRPDPGLHDPADHHPHVARRPSRAVPQVYREVSFSLGSTQWQTVARVVLPIGPAGHRHRRHPERRPQHRRDGGGHLHRRHRALRSADLALRSSRTMAVHFYILAREGISMTNAYGTAAVLIIAILAINILTYCLMNRFIRKYS
ncbi:MAG: hypothetical protein MZV70_52905 [Desulfobacterales bacterium]|nr:hypothetical protein [Desulfobacterales bacterium]